MGVCKHPYNYPELFFLFLSQRKGIYLIHGGLHGPMVVKGGLSFKPIPQITPTRTM